MCPRDSETRSSGARISISNTKAILHSDVESSVNNYAYFRRGRLHFKVGEDVTLVDLAALCIC